MEGYFGVIAIQKIADQGKATYAASFEKAIKSARNINLGGVIPPWTPNKSVSKVVPRVSNGSEYNSEWDNGKLKLLTAKPVDVTTMVDKSNS